MPPQLPVIAIVRVQRAALSLNFRMPGDGDVVVSCEPCSAIPEVPTLFDDVPVRVRRLLTCRCQAAGEVKSFPVLDLEATTVAPELAYVTARYAGLAPFGKVAALLS